MHMNNEAFLVEEGVATAIEVGNYISYFSTGSSLKDFMNHINLVAETTNAKCFKLVVCKRTERACHNKEGYALDICVLNNVL